MSTSSGCAPSSLTAACAFVLCGDSATCSSARRKPEATMKSLRVRLVMYLLVPFVMLLPIAAALDHVVGWLPVRTALDQGLERLAIVVAGYLQRRGDEVRLALS